MQTIERFTKKYRKLKNGCWEWQAATSPKGYGMFYYDGRPSGRAHRFSYEHFVGKIPNGYTIDHLCRNRRCVNPKHLEAVTNKENVLRGNGLTAQNARKTHCIKGHPLSGDNLMTRNYRNTVMRNCKICTRKSQKEWRIKTFIITRYKEELKVLTGE